MEDAGVCSNVDEPNRRFSHACLQSIPDPVCRKILDKSSSKVTFTPPPGEAPPSEIVGPMATFRTEDGRNWAHPGIFRAGANSTAIFMSASWHASAQVQTQKSPAPFCQGNRTFFEILA